MRDIKKLFKRTDTKMKIDRLLTVILIISIVISISMLLYVIIMPKEGERFTVFYLLGPGGMAADFPSDLKLGEQGEVIIGIENREHANVSYHLKVKLDREILVEKSVDLVHNEIWESLFIFRATRLGEDQKLLFLLYKEGVPEVHRSLHLWVDVRARKNKF
ncbi:MAG: DUF1616 domain-containing protein [Methanophagales archaeon]|nr:DUF1616 domain-containing protein [Methanophagales archaeon]